MENSRYKFRAWCKKGKEMITDFWIEAKDGECFGKYSMQAYPEWELMQFTGFKDKNGKEVYEGDIITTNAIRIVNTYPLNVIFMDGGFYPFCKSNSYGVSLGDGIEVIGNMYENPELWSGQNR